ncbi:9731_t:CDS:2, partial [Gigaspora rosea]
KVSKEIIQNIKEKKLQDQEKIIASQDTKSSLSVKSGQGLFQELFTPEPSLQEYNNNSKPFMDKAFDAEDGANGANQEEIFGSKIGEKKARRLLYDSITKQLSIIHKKRSQELGLHLPEISRDDLRKKTQKAEKIYILSEKIDHDKIKYIKSYSAKFISKLTNDQIQEIINYSCQNVDTGNARHQILSENTEISETGGPGKISSEINTSMGGIKHKCPPDPKPFT